MKIHVSAQQFLAAASARPRFNSPKPNAGGTVADVRATTSTATGSTATGSTAIGSTASGSTASGSATDVSTATDITAPDAPVSYPRELDAALEAGRRLRAENEREDGSRVDDDDDHDRGAAPGAVALAQDIVRAVRSETHAFTRGNSGLSHEQRAEIRDAAKDLRHDLRDAAAAYTAADRSFDLAGFLGEAAEAVGEFGEEFAETMGIEIEEPDADDADGDEGATPGDDPIDGNTDAGTTPTRPDDPTPTSIDMTA